MSLPLLSFGPAPGDGEDGSVPARKAVDVSMRHGTADTGNGAIEADRTLIARVRVGDDDAFDEMFRAHYEAACDYAARFVSDGAVAEDLAQDVFARMLERRALLQIDTTIRGYVLRAVRRAALHYLRHGRVIMRHAATVVEAPFTMPVADAWIVNAEVTQLVEHAASTLPPRVQEAFLLRWRYELRYDEIAAAMGVSRKTVETHLTRAHKAVREALAGYVERQERDTESTQG